MSEQKVRAIPLAERKPTPADADSSGDVLWLEDVDGAWVAWSGPFYDHKGMGESDKCSGVATHWSPLSVFTTGAT